MSRRDPDLAVRRLSDGRNPVEASGIVRNRYGIPFSGEVGEPVYGWGEIAVYPDVPGLVDEKMRPGVIHGPAVVFRYGYPPSSLVPGVDYGETPVREENVCAGVFDEDVADDVSGETEF